MRLVVPLTQIAPIRVHADLPDRRDQDVLGEQVLLEICETYG